mmetsp:Transcript_9033/g.20041  ORF Transcript_9033/g.20041 Transcript_9033/m.20041 type:complete len:231 (+) Transcript_9033:552-1244(+)
MRYATRPWISWLSSSWYWPIRPAWISSQRVPRLPSKLPPTWRLPAHGCPLRCSTTCRLSWLPTLRSSWWSPSSRRHATSWGPSARTASYRSGPHAARLPSLPGRLWRPSSGLPSFGTPGRASSPRQPPGPADPTPVSPTSSWLPSKRIYGTSSPTASPAVHAAVPAPPAAAAAAAVPAPAAATATATCWTGLPIWRCLHSIWRLPNEPASCPNSAGHSQRGRSPSCCGSH